MLLKDRLKLCASFLRNSLLKSFRVIKVYDAVIKLGLQIEYKSRLPGEISITSDMQMTPPLWQKAKRS